MCALYEVGLKADTTPPNGKKHIADAFDACPTFDDTLAKLQAFLSRHGGQFKGWYQQDGAIFIGTAMVDIPKRHVPDLERCSFVSRIPLAGFSPHVMEAKGSYIIPEPFLSLNPAP